jgi:hypothetical protein
VSERLDGKKILQFSYSNCQDRKNNPWKGYISAQPISIDETEQEVSMEFGSGNKIYRQVFKRTSPQVLQGLGSIVKAVYCDGESAKK